MVGISTRKQACLFCRIRKLKCVVSGRILPDGTKDPCGNCMIYRCHCEKYTGINDKSLIKTLSDENYNSIMVQKEKMSHMNYETEPPKQSEAEEKALLKDNSFYSSTNQTPPLPLTTPNNGINENILAFNIPATDYITSINTSQNPKPQTPLVKSLSETLDSGISQSKFLLPRGDVTSEVNGKIKALKLLQAKIKELEPVLLSGLDENIKPLLVFLKTQVELKTNELSTLRQKEEESECHNKWNIVELKKITSKAKYDNTNSMETTVPVDKFDIVKNNKISYKPKKRSHSEMDNNEVGSDDIVIRSLENQLLRYSGYSEIRLNALLSFNINTVTGEIISTPQVSYWNNNDSKDHEPGLHYLPPFFGDYNADSFISKPGLELVFEEILKSNSNFEIIPEREIKETLFLVLKFVQYYLSCGNMAIDIFTEPFEYYGNNLLPELDKISKTSEKLLFLYSKIPSNLIDETLKQYPKFKDIHNNVKKYITEPSYSPTLLQFTVLLNKTHQSTYQKEILSFFVFKEQLTDLGKEEPEVFNYSRNLAFFEVEDILLIFFIYFLEKARYSSSESLDFIESVLLKFEQMFTFQCKTVSYEILSTLVKSVREIGLHKFEYYLEIDEAMAEKQRKLFWKCIYWETSIQVGYGMPPLFSLNLTTCLLPKIFIDLGVMTIEDLKWFLLNEGYKCMFNVEIQEEFELLNTSLAIIISEFMQEVLFNRKYTGINSFLKTEKHRDMLLKSLIADIENYNRFSTVFKVLIDNIYRKLLNMEMSRNLGEESTKLTYLKYLANASIFRSYMLTSSISLLIRVKTTAKDQKSGERANDLIDVYAQLVMTNELNTLNIILIAEKAAFFLKSFDAISKCLSNITCMASYFKKSISSEVFINIVRLHKIQRMTFEKLINKDVYANKDTIHRIPSFANLFCHRLRLASRIIAQLFMSQRSLNKVKLKEFFRLKLSQFISDTKELAEELDFIFDTKLMENDYFANVQFSMNKKRYDLILKRYKKMNKDFTKVTSSNNLKRANPHTHPFNSEAEESKFSKGDIAELLKTTNADFIDNQSNVKNSNPILDSHNVLFNKSNLVTSPNSKFHQSDERHQSVLANRTPIDNPSTISESSNNTNPSNENTARNMVERIDFGSMEDFLTNNDNLFANFWQGFNMD